MTPDMRRLALAVAKVRWHDWDLSDEEWTDEALANFECEAIVRAVLTELREVGEVPLAAGSVDLLRLVTDPWDCMDPDMEWVFGLDEDGPDAFVAAEERIRPNMKRAFTAMLNSILAEPATA